MNKVILIDSNSLINRAFYAMPPLQIASGLYTNAIYGYLAMLQKLISDEKPTHIGAVFDCRAKTFRHLEYDAYKATRKGMPEELAQQVPVLQELLALMGVKILFKECYEADDIIGTIAKRFDAYTIIVSGDKDVLQLVDDTTVVYHTRRGVSDVKIYDKKALLEEGFTPEQIIDYKGLAGDSSDNIPGAPGVGAKTAMNLLNSYHSIEGVYENIEQLKGKLKENLMLNKDKVMLSRSLATIHTSVDIDCSLDDMAFHYPINMKAKVMMQELQLRNLIGRFAFTEVNENITVKNNDAIKVDDVQDGVEETVFGLKIDAEVKTLQNFDDTKREIDKIPKGSKIFISWHGQDKIIVAYSNIELVIMLSYDLFGEGITESEAGNFLAVLLSKNYHKIMFDIKQYMHFFCSFKINIEPPYDDILLMGYLVNSNKVIKDEEGLLADYGFGSINKGVEALSLHSVLKNKIAETGLQKLYYDIELPLIICLFDMERAGFKIDIEVLEELDKYLSGEIAGLLENIYSIAGEQFNVNSNKQLGVILFEKLKLPHIKKNKTGYAVGAEILEELEHPIIEFLLRYRQMAKLKSTYIDGMRAVMNKGTFCVHTSFKQCLTATGRLSSTEPNLQNIPVKRAEGREIRRMFIPSKDCLLVMADYSQIELRLLAHFSNDEHLIYAYEHNIDIHTLTASKIFKTPIEEVTSAMRSSAKAVNFGIIYGISNFGLAKNAMVSNSEAKEFIKEYFATYPRVKEYMDNNVKLAKQQGYLKTLEGRIRYFPELTSPQYAIRAFGERAAMNMPLQGSASDIIKIAMLNVNKALKDHNLCAKIILQVHDELILDTPIEEVEQVKILLKNGMESAAKLRIPLTANVSVGKNWLEEEV